MFSLYPLSLLIAAVAARPFLRPGDPTSSVPALTPRNPRPPVIVPNPTRSDQMSVNTFVAIIFCSFLFVLLIVLFTLLRKDRYRRLWRWLCNRHTHKGHERSVNVPDVHSTNPLARCSRISPIVPYPPKAFQRT